jgi:hypothetical protein
MVRMLETRAWRTLLLWSHATFDPIAQFRHKCGRLGAVGGPSTGPLTEHVPVGPVLGLGHEDVEDLEFAGQSGRWIIAVTGVVVWYTRMASHRRIDAGCPE